jgi:hypothetical protein
MLQELVCELLVKNQQLRMELMAERAELARIQARRVLHEALEEMNQEASL